MALCTQDDIEKRLQWDITAEPDAVITMLIADAQSLIEAEVGRTLESATRSETFDGGQRTLFLKWFPVTTLTSVVEDGTTLTVEDDFRWYSNGRLIRVSGNYQTRWRVLKHQSIVVTYEGGYLTGEPDHDMALEHLGNLCAEVVARAFRKGADSAAIPAGAAGQVQSVSLAGSDTTTYATSGGSATFRGGLTQFVYLEEDERRQLGRYKNLAVA